MYAGGGELRRFLHGVPLTLHSPMLRSGLPDWLEISCQTVPVSHIASGCESSAGCSPWTRGML
jgi:hypothetical protein